MQTGSLRQMLCVGGGRYGESLVDVVCRWEGGMGVFSGWCVPMWGGMGAFGGGVWCGGDWG